MKKLVLILGLLASFAVSVAAATVRLADENTMRRQLASVVDPNDDDDVYFIEKLHPKLLAHAGMQKAPCGVVMMFAFTLSETMRDLPRPVQLAMRMRLSQLLPQYVRAVLPDNPTEADEIINSMIEATMVNPRDV